MNVQVRALTPFMHGRKNLSTGGTEYFTKAEANDLAKAGLVEIVDGSEISDEDLLGKTKADVEPVQNKMAPAPANKTTTAKK